MTSQTKTRAQTYFDEVEALKSEGMSNAEAVRTVAAKHRKTIGSIRGSLYQHKTHHLGGTNGSRRSRRTRSVEDHIDSARRSLHDALDLIDHEVADAKDALDSAQARYDEITASVEQRKAEINERINALS